MNFMIWGISAVMTVSRFYDRLPTRGQRFFALAYHGRRCLSLTRSGQYAPNHSIVGLRWRPSDSCTHAGSIAPPWLPVSSVFS
jgi:hypothetical protein